jgi:hypothetical protein
MEFYKEGRVLTVLAGTTLDLGEAQYNHKAVFIVSDAATINDIINNSLTLCQIKIYSKTITRKLKNYRISKNLIIEMSR